MSNDNIADPSPFEQPRRSTYGGEDAVARIVDALGGNFGTGMCSCPAHDDRDPSFKVERSADGKLLVHCFAGCSQAAVVAALKERSLWPQGGAAGRPDPALEALRREAERHSFDLARQIVQLANHNEPIRQQLLAPYFAGRGGATPLAVPPTANFIAAERLAWLHEGERRRGEAAHHIGHHGRYDAMVVPMYGATAHGPLALSGVELTFLTADHSAHVAAFPRQCFGALGIAPLGGDWPPDRPLIVAESYEDAACCSQLTGLPAISAVSTGCMPNLHMILPDDMPGELIVAAQNDKPGRLGGEACARALAAKRRVRLAVSRNKDWNDDWRDTRLRTEDLAAALRNAPLVRSGLPPSLMTLSEFLAVDAPPLRPLIAPFVYADSVTTIHGPTGVMKTKLVLGLLKAVATGGAFVAFADWAAAVAPLPVLYVDFELRTGVVQQWIRQLGRLPEHFYPLCRDHVERTYGGSFALTDEPVRQWLYRWIAERGIKLACFDSHAAGLAVYSLDDEARTAPILDELQRTCTQRLGCSLIVVQHDNRANQQSGYAQKQHYPEVNIHLLPVDDAPGEGGDGSPRTRLDLTCEKNRHLPRRQWPRARLSYQLLENPDLWKSGADTWSAEPIPVTNKKSGKGRP